MQATGGAMEAVQVRACEIFLCFLCLLIALTKVRDGRGGYDDFPGSRREEEQRNSYSAFDYSESSSSNRGEVEGGSGFGDSFDLPSMRRQFIR